MGGALEDVLTPLLEPGYRLATLLLADTAAAEREVEAAAREAIELDSVPPADHAAAWFLGAVYEACRPGRNAETPKEARPLVRTIAKLPAEDRAAFFLFYWLRLPPAEVAAAVGVSPDEIGDRLDIQARFGSGWRPRDVSNAFEELTQAAPYGFERKVLSAAAGPPLEPEHRGVPPVAWAGIAALAVVALLLVAIVGPMLDPAVHSKLAALTTRSSPTPTATASPSPAPSPVASPAPSASPTAAPAVSGSCTVTVPAEPQQSQPVSITQVRVGTDASRDRFVVQVDGAVPPFELQPASGGWLLVIHGANLGTYSGPTDFKTGYPVLTEAKSAGGAAGSAGWSLSVSSATSCPLVSTLTGPSRIVIDFPH